MKINKRPPNIFVCAPNRRDVYGAITIPTHLEIQYNFGTFSEMKFEISQKIYDEVIEEYIDNQIYDELVENNLIYVPKENNVFSYSTNKLLNDSDYGIDTDANQPNKQSNVKSGVDVLEYTPKMRGCKLQSETQLFDVGAKFGYCWNYRKEIYGTISSATSSGYIIDANGMSNIAQDVFFPVKVGDIIAMGSQVDKTNTSDLYCSVSSGLGEERYKYLMYFYDNANSNSCKRFGDINTGNKYKYESYSPIKRYRVKDGDFGAFLNNYLGQGYYDYTKNGYVRFSGFVPSGATSPSSPGAGYVRIFDGERRCKEVNVQPKENIKHSIPWWVITKVEEEKNNINNKKIITAYSYEYTISQRSVSLDDDTLPLYIPDNIVDVVTSENFVIDKWDGIVTKGAQRMKRGLINQILDYLSGWEVKYISEGLCTRYRQIESVDNVNIYTFLMNTVQSKYQCHIIFDCKNLNINIVSHEDIITASNTNVIFDWRNSIKKINISNTDQTYITALRIHTEDDTYGVGLVNPNGTNVIYNFNNIIQKLNYSVDETHINQDTQSPYTLSELIVKYNTQLLANINNSSVTSYRSLAQSLISNINEVGKFQVAFADSIAQYNKIIDENNIFVKMNGHNTFPPEVPPVNSSFESNGEWSYIDPSTNSPRTCWASEDKWKVIKAVTENYWIAKIAYETYNHNISASKFRMKRIANVLSLNINTLKKIYEGATFDNNGHLELSSYPCIFTPVEAIELFKYIYECDWTEQNIVFNEKYSVNDIYNTLIDVYNTAVYEMDNIYCKPNYDFETDIADVFHSQEISVICDNLYLGNTLYLNEDNGYIEPLLLVVNVSYDDYNSTKMTFTTDYKRKPITLRVYELLSTIQQKSVTTPTFTFDN